MKSPWGTAKNPQGLKETMMDVELNHLNHATWAGRYFVTTVGRDEEVIRAYFRNQELADQKLE
jgi:REP element-mobilizing transposase RayT